MSIETEITRISTNVSDTLSAISEMGGTVPENATSDDMANGVRSIPVGAKIDDSKSSPTTTYSSQKIDSEISKLNEANAAQNTEIAKKANDADLAKVAKSGSYTDLTNKPTIPTVPSTLPNPNALTFTGAVNETYDGSAAKSVSIPTIPESLKNPNKLILSGAVTAEYDGSAEVSVEIPAGGGSAYELPIASPTTLGGVQPAAKTDEMTQAVGVDAEGKLYAPAAALPTDDQVSTAVDAYLTANGVKCNDVWVDAGTITVAEGEAPTQLVWNLDGAIKKYYMEGTTIGHSGSENLGFVVRSGTGTVCRIVQKIDGNWPAGTTNTIYVKAEAEEKANGKFWYGLTRASTFGGPPVTLLAGEENVGTNVTALSIGAYWNNQAFPVGTSFNLKVVYK